MERERKRGTMEMDFVDEKNKRRAAEDEKQVQKKSNGNSFWTKMCFRTFPRLVKISRVPLCYKKRK